MQNIGQSQIEMPSVKKQLWYIAGVAVAFFVVTQFGPSLVRYIRMKQM